MKLLPTLLIVCGLLASPMVLAEEPPKHGEPGHDHAKDHGQTTTPEAKPENEHKGESAEDHAKHGHGDHEQQGQCLAAEGEHVLGRHGRVSKKERG